MLLTRTASPIATPMIARCFPSVEATVRRVFVPASANVYCSVSPGVSPWVRRMRSPSL